MPQTLLNLPPDVLFCIFTRDEMELADILRLSLVSRTVSPYARLPSPLPSNLRLSPVLTACAPFRLRNEDVQGVTGRRAPQALGH